MLTIIPDVVVARVSFQAGFYGWGLFESSIIYLYVQTKEGVGAVFNES